MEIWGRNSPPAVVVYGVEQDGQEEAHHRRMRDHLRMSTGEPKYQATGSAEPYVHGVWAETWWKLGATCGKVSADGKKMIAGGSELLRGPGRGVSGRTGA